MFRPLLVVVAAASAALAFAAPPGPADVLAPFPHPAGYVCPRATGPVVVDGDLSDAAWAAAPWTAAFADIEGTSKPKPRHRTRAKMLWDADALYIAAELDEPHVWGNITDHDAVIFQDNDFEVFLDPDGDNHLYAELELNARNTTWDLLLTKPYKDGGKAVNAWEITGLKTAVRVVGTLNNPADTDTGWTVEIRWPWAGLKELGAAAPPAAGDRWRINFSRVEWDTEVVGGTYQKVKGKPEHNWVWSPQGVIDMHRPERWGYLQFAETAKEAFRPDPDWATRDRLHQAYYAQSAYRVTHGKYAATLGLLDRPPAGPMEIETTRRGFTAAAAGAGPKPKTYTITHDGRITSE